MRTKGAKDKKPRTSRLALVVKLSELNKRLQPEATVCVSSSYRKAFTDLGIRFEEKVNYKPTEDVVLEEAPQQQPEIKVREFHAYDSE